MSYHLRVLTHLMPREQPFLAMVCGLLMCSCICPATFFVYFAKIKKKEEKKGSLNSRN